MEKAVKRQLLSLDNLPGELELQLSCDKTIVFGSSSLQLWHLLAQVLMPFCSPVVAVVLHYGAGEPSDFSYLLNKSTSMLTAFLTDVIKVGIVCVTVLRTAVLHYTAVVAFIRQVRSHAGYYGYSKCV